MGKVFGKLSRPMLGGAVAKPAMMQTQQGPATQGMSSQQLIAVSEAYKQAGDALIGVGMADGGYYNVGAEVPVEAPLPGPVEPAMPVSTPAPRKTFSEKVEEARMSIRSGGTAVPKQELPDMGVDTVDAKLAGGEIRYEP